MFYFMCQRSTLCFNFLHNRTEISRFLLHIRKCNIIENYILKVKRRENKIRIFVVTCHQSSCVIKLKRRITLRPKTCEESRNTVYFIGHGDMYLVVTTLHFEFLSINSLQYNTNAQLKS